MISISKEQRQQQIEQRTQVADMQKDMIKIAMNITQQAIQKYDVESDIAKYIKQQFDSLYYPNWHCIVGKSFATVVTYQSRHYIHFKISELSVILFKFG